MDAPCFVYCTFPDAAAALACGRTLVTERLCACVNVLPGMRSVYRWQDAVEEAAEAVLIAKTLRSRADALADRLRALHTYDVPCIVAIDVAALDPTWAAWLADAAQGGDP